MIEVWNACCWVLIEKNQIRAIALDLIIVLNDLNDWLIHRHHLDLVAIVLRQKRTTFRNLRNDWNCDSSGGPGPAGLLKL